MLSRRDSATSPTNTVRVVARVALSLPPFFLSWILGAVGVPLFLLGFPPCFPVCLQRRRLTINAALNLPSSLAPVPPSAPSDGSPRLFASSAHQKNTFKNFSFGRFAAIDRLTVSFYVAVCLSVWHRRPLRLLSLPPSRRCRHLRPWSRDGPADGGAGGTVEDDAKAKKRRSVLPIVTNADCHHDDGRRPRRLQEGTAKTHFLRDPKPADDVNGDLTDNGRKKVSDHVVGDAKARGNWQRHCAKTLYSEVDRRTFFRRLGACFSARLLPPSLSLSSSLLSSSSSSSSSSAWVRTRPTPDPWCLLFRPLFYLFARARLCRPRGPFFFFFRQSSAGRLPVAERPRHSIPPHHFQPGRPLRRKNQVEKKTRAPASAPPPRGHRPTDDERPSTKEQRGSFHASPRSAIFRKKFLASFSCRLSSPPAAASPSQGRGPP
ncbi:hypothetical protein pqer_cds_14 [Pandoravirus quercus]|uniref:Transmembrane protein n=1 Tax=Pandoravirus quercus TaxID=2107709 RepID=A0A2U7U7P1_9VIRU|nr:hypothetical protein pqer_cds_14 [Pandoravirus quercus]AVK74436.1 hypothetical protein pqer_cds_14 [Pandoravirus quercus]